MHSIRSPAFIPCLGLRVIFVADDEPGQEERETVSCFHAPANCWLGASQAVGPQVVGSLLGRLTTPWDREPFLVQASTCSEAKRQPEGWTTNRRFMG